MPPSPLHGRSPLSVAETVLGRLASLIVIGAIGLTALAATGHAGGPFAVRGATSTAAVVHEPAMPSARAATAARPSPPTHRPVAKRSVTKRAAARTASRPRAAARYIPTGTGMWLYEWSRSNHGRARSIVAQAKRFGLSTLYLRTGSSWDGFTGRSTLPRLLAATRGTKIRVVAWDFPRLRHPRHDAQRLARAARASYGGARVAAVAPDIETPSEGTFNAARRVRIYLQTLRRLLPKNVSILTAVPWPSRFRVADYPYRTVAAGSDVLMPMAYWYEHSPVRVTARSIAYLRRFGRPVEPVGQGYDGKLDVPSLRHNRLYREVPAFLRTARAHGVRAVSFWSWQAAPSATWRALILARRLFPAHH